MFGYFLIIKILGKFEGNFIHILLICLHSTHQKKYLNATSFQEIFLQNQKTGSSILQSINKFKHQTVLIWWDLPRPKRLNEF